MSGERDISSVFSTVHSGSIGALYTDKRNVGSV